MRAILNLPRQYDVSAQARPPRFQGGGRLVVGAQGHSAHPRLVLFGAGEFAARRAPLLSFHAERLQAEGPLETA